MDANKQSTVKIYYPDEIQSESHSATVHDLKQYYFLQVLFKTVSMELSSLQQSCQSIW